MFLGNISAIVRAVELVFVYSDLSNYKNKRAGGGRNPQGTVTRMCVNFRKNRMCVNYRNQTSKVVYIKMLIIMFGTLTKVDMFSPFF